MKKRSAFTIVELLVSIMIIGILASLGYQQYTKAVDTAKAKGLTQLIKKLNTANADFLRTYGEYPTEINNTNLLKMIRAMEFKIDEDVAGTKVLANLGPRTYFELTDVDNSYPIEGSVASTSSFRYIVIRNVPSRIAAEVAKEVNGKVNEDLLCHLAGQGFFIAIQKPGNVTIDAGACVANKILTEASSGQNNVDIWYTFSRSIDSGAAAWN